MNQIMKKADLIISILLIAFIGFYAFLTINLPARNLPNTLGVDFMPWILVICLSLLSILLLLKAIFGRPVEKGDSTISLKEGLGVLFLTAIIFVYVKAISLFGFIIITPIFIAVLMLFTGSRKWKEVVIVSLVATFGIYLFFQKIFQVLLPAGTIF
jgi:putative tricarboxylic transport membrane protein